MTLQGEEEEDDDDDPSCDDIDAMPIDDGGLADLPAWDFDEAEAKPGSQTIAPITEPLKSSLKTLATVEQAAESSNGESIKTIAPIEEAAESSTGESLQTFAPVEQAAESCESLKTTAPIEQAAESSKALRPVKQEPRQSPFEVPESSEIPATQPDPSPSKWAFKGLFDPSMADTLVIRSPPSIP